MFREIPPLLPIEPIRGYTPVHSALYLGCSQPGVYKLINEGRLQTRLIGKRRVIPGSELIRFITGKGPVIAGDPIDPKKSAMARKKGRAGGLAKARKHQLQALGD
jgi:hypothetical protein